MIYTTQTNANRIWHDEVEFVTNSWAADLYLEQTLSKKKLLKNLSEIKVLNELHMIILDNLSKLSSIRRYQDIDSVIFSLEDNTEIIINIINWEFFELLKNSIISTDTSEQ